MNLETITAEYGDSIDALIEKYGSATNIPRDEMFLVSEKLRAGYCLLANPNMNPVDVFKYYSVDGKVWGYFVSNAPEQTVIKKQKRTDKLKTIIDWTQENVFEEVTPQTIMDIGEISYPTAIKIINDRPDIFKRIKRGLYEIRDPKSDREVQKL